jgi:MinD superfamily P-loop ATPase
MKKCLERHLAKKLCEWRAYILVVLEKMFNTQEKGCRGCYFWATFLAIFSQPHLVTLHSALIAQNPIIANFSP